MVAVRTGPPITCYPAPFISKEGYVGLGVDPSFASDTPLKFCIDEDRTQQYARSMQSETPDRHGEMVASELIMYTTYYFKAPTADGSLAHVHDFQTVTVWVTGNDTIRAICLS